ncbi:MAG: exodeoxyribonuclease VII large subunit [Alphaproteobacteria bacterium]|nr:exodeoxyribonuclease VII large subunit [Alphaproteobacteria bacterium]
MPETLSPGNPALHNVPEYTVGDIAGAVKRIVEERFGRVRVRGEISAWKVHSSGHGYFRLKDGAAVLDAVCWKNACARIPFAVEEGMEVIATGRITTYPGKSSYQIVVEHLEPAGVGALMALLEKRRAMLAAEGLFAAERKKALPFLPRVIGVVTSPTGAVLRDILHRLSERCGCHVILWPVAVQGEGAAAQLAAAIAGFQTLMPRPDVLIVARGGGSVEDLWAFNEEIVVRAVAASAIPLISAVGHETDTTLIDFVSDRRAPTPTAAAEMAVPVRDELLLTCGELQCRLQAGMTRYLTHRRDVLRGLMRGLPRPHALLEHRQQRLDDWRERLAQGLPALLSRKHQQWAVLAAALKPQLLVKDIHLLEGCLKPLGQRLSQSIARALDQRTRQLQQLSSLLSTLDYAQTLKRGFALVTRADGSPVTSKAAAHGRLRLMFHDGVVEVAVKE